MCEIMLYFIIVVLIFVSFCWLKHSPRPENFPPGPRPWPLIGNLGSIAISMFRVKLHHLVWDDWAKTYGNLVGVKMGSTDMVLVFGKEMIREVASRTEFDGRPSGFFYTLRTFGKKSGIVFADGLEWHQRRKVVLKCLRTFGFGSRLMEVSINAEAKSLEHALNKTLCRPVDVNTMFDVAIINVLWGFLSGQRYELHDERLLNLCRLMQNAFKISDMSGGIMNYMPFLRHIIPELIGYTELKSVYAALHEFIAETIENHKRTLNANQPRDAIDAFLIDMQKNKDDAWTDEELQVVCLDLLQAGAETVANTMVFLIVYMIRHPDVQQRVYEEIAQVCSENRAVELDDRIRMPYTEAVTMEVLRLSSVAPMGIMHEAMCNTRLGGYAIPKGTLILLSLYSMHMNRYWQDPETFRPERFLDKDGLVVQDDWLIAFGAGRRKCIGESLARAELFLFFTNLMLKFEVVNPKGCPLPDTVPINGITLSAKQFKAVFIPRHAGTTV